MCAQECVRVCGGDIPCDLSVCVLQFTFKPSHQHPLLSVQPTHGLFQPAGVRSQRLLVFPHRLHHHDAAAFAPQPA